MLQLFIRSPKFVRSLTSFSKCVQMCLGQLKYHSEWRSGRWFSVILYASWSYDPDDGTDYWDHHVRLSPINHPRLQLHPPSSPAPSHSWSVITPGSYITPWIHHAIQLCPPSSPAQRSHFPYVKILTTSPM